MSNKNSKTGTFVFVQYTGPNADVVLRSVMSDDPSQNPQMVAAESQTQVRMGFQPEPYEPEEDDEDE